MPGTPRTDPLALDKGEQPSLMTASDRLDVPAAESPLWFPQIARTGNQGLAGSLPKFGLTSPSNQSSKRDRDLYSTDTLPPLEQYELPSLKSQKVCTCSCCSMTTLHTFRPTGCYLVLVAANLLAKHCRVWHCGAIQGHAVSPSKGSTWQITSNSVKSKTGKAAKSLERSVEDSTRTAPPQELDMLPVVPSATSASADSSLEQTPNIKTGSDVVAFYAKYGQDSPIKFFYCNRLEACTVGQCSQSAR